MVSLKISAAGKAPSIARELPITIAIEGKQVEDALVVDVKKAIAAKFPKFDVTRQKLTLKGDKKALADDATLKDSGVVDGEELSLKDLGPQISWRTVFLVEYAGPLVIHPLFYYFPKAVYGGPVQHSMLQSAVYAMCMLHFVKRELETLYVHRFSHATMPARNILKNSAHYWIFSGFALAAAIYSPQYSVFSSHVRGTTRDNPKFIWAGVALWLFAEVSNFATHVTLRKLRPEGTRRRAIPYGFGFAVVSCPNYLFELIGWATISGLTGSWVAWLFTAMSAVQMGQWALKKHKAYKKEFGNDYPRDRSAMIPFIF